MGTASGCPACCQNKDGQPFIQTIGVPSSTAYDEAAVAETAATKDEVLTPVLDGQPGESESEEELDGSAPQAVPAAASQAAKQETAQAQQLVRAFVQAYVRGRNLSVLSVSGGLVECLVSLDRKLSKLSLQRPGKKETQRRSIPLETVGEIRVGEEVGQELNLPVDEMCVTLCLQEGQAVGFRFNDAEARDTFALCISMFADERRSQLSRTGSESIANSA